MPRVNGNSPGFSAEDDRLTGIPHGVRILSVLMGLAPWANAMLRDGKKPFSLEEQSWTLVS